MTKMLIISFFKALSRLFSIKQLSLALINYDNL